MTAVSPARATAAPVVSTTTALVTGAAGGIGAAVVRRLRAAGFRVAALDLDADGLSALAAADDGVLAVPCDVTSESSVAQAYAATVAAFGAPWAVVNVAGYFDRHLVPDLALEEWNRFMAVNLTGPFLVCRAALPAMIAAHDGCIVNIASTAGVRGGRGRAAYCAAKGGLVQLTRSLALDHGPDGVRVNIVAPGLIDTPMADWIRHDEAAMAEFDASIPAGRIGTPEEVAELVAFVASPAASYLWGATLMVDGGVSA